MKEVVATGMDFSPGRHAGHASHKAVVESDASIRESLEVGGVNPVTSIWWEHSSVQRIEHNHNGFHIIYLHGDKAEYYTYTESILPR
jgi:hypothetical protein